MQYSDVFAWYNTSFAVVLHAGHLHLQLCLQHQVSLLQACDTPVLEQRNGNGMDSAEAGPGARIELKDKAFPDLTMQGADMGRDCLFRFTSLAANEQVVLLKALLSELKEGLADQVKSRFLFEIRRHPCIAAQSALALIFLK